MNIIICHEHYYVVIDTGSVKMRDLMIEPAREGVTSLLHFAGFLLMSLDVQIQQFCLR